MSLKTSIILCTYNESKYIKETITEVKKNISNLELIIIDDNSTDKTREIIENLNHDKEIKLIHRKKSRSLASAFLRGVIESSGNYIGWLDTNMPEVAPKFIEMSSILKPKADVAILSRYIEGGSDKRNLLRSVSSKYFNIVCRLILRSSIKDYTTSIFLMKREVINEVTFLGYGHGEFFVEFLYNANKKGFKIVEVPFTQKKDEDLELSKSSPNILKFFYLGFMYFLRILSTITRRE